MGCPEHIVDIGVCSLLYAFGVELQLALVIWKIDWLFIQFTWSVHINDGYHDWLIVYSVHFICTYFWLSCFRSALYVTHTWTYSVELSHHLEGHWISLPYWHSSFWMSLLALLLRFLLNFQQQEHLKKVLHLVQSLLILLCHRRNGWKGFKEIVQRAPVVSIRLFCSFPSLTLQNFLRYQLS